MQFSDREGLLQALNDAAHEIIGIDGFQCSGKTTLANWLHEQMAGTLVRIDTLVDKNPVGYVDYLRVDELLSAVSGKPPPVILEGICLLAVCQRARIVPAHNIYVKRLHFLGDWKGEDLFYPVASSVPPHPLPPLRQEVVNYHCHFQPDQRADSVYLWREQL